MSGHFTSCPRNSAFMHLLDGQKEQKRQINRNPVENRRESGSLQNQSVIVNSIKVRLNCWVYTNGAAASCKLKSSP